MDDTLLLARIKDICDSVYFTDKHKFLGFLSVEEAAFAEKYLKNRNIKYSFFGGADSCERTYLACFPEWAENIDFPITAVTFTFRKIDNLHHRDFLGALMALGLKRETVGDILIEEGRAVVFLNSDIVKYVIDNVTKVGNVGVTAKVDFNNDLPSKNELKEFTVTVSSLRLDCIVAALANISRNNALSLIEGGLVSVNSVITEKSTKMISDNDVISIRHKGKFSIVSSSKRTKKDRKVIKYKSY